MNLVEYISCLAQQIQTGRHPNQSHLAFLREIHGKGGIDAELIELAIKSVDSPKLARSLRKRHAGIPASTPKNAPGKRVILYKAALPVEAQSRVAADSLIARYISWLGRNKHRRAVALAESSRHVLLFVPEGSDFNADEAWQEFVAFAFSGEELVRTFVAMLNSVQLSDRGFGVPEFPIVSRDQRFIILAWLLRSVRTVEERLRRRQASITQLQGNLSGGSEKEQRRIRKEIKELRMKQEKEFTKYGQNFTRRFSTFLEDQKNAWRRTEEYRAQLSNGRLNPAQQKRLQKRLNAEFSKVELTQDQLVALEKLVGEATGDPLIFLEKFATQHHTIFERARSLTRFFHERAARQINLSRGDNFANALLEIVRLTSWLEPGDSNQVGTVRAQELRVRSLLRETPELHTERFPGDGTGEFCYVCGQLVAREDKAQVNRFVFRSPSQRLQSVRGEQRPPVCCHCVAFAFVSPLKPSDQSVIIRLDAVTQRDSESGRSVIVLGKLESFLRGITLSQLDLAAGDYMMLTSNERVKVGKKWRPLSDVIGAVIYAYLRLAGLFDHQIFEDYHARIVTGISDIRLESHRLAFLSILMNSLELQLTEGSEVNRSLAAAARYVLGDDPIPAIYELVSKPEIGSKRRRERVHIEIEKSSEVWIKMIGENRAKMITDVVGMAGLLFPFVDQTIRKKGDPSIDPEREASKLIEEVDEVFNFVYRFAHNTNYTTARLYRNPTNWFTYEQTKALLERIGIDPNEREKTENTSRFLEVNANDVEAAYKRFAEADYKADADWRAFTYRLKLALYSRFPRLVGKKEKSEEK